jgi:hypothetical protein
MTSRCASVLLSLFCFFASNAWAQATGAADDSAGSKVLYEVGFHVGDLLPNQIPGVTEIIGLGGVRAGFRIAPQTFCEGGLIMGNGSGVEWKNAHVDLRMDIPVENLVGFAYLGADSLYYKGLNQGSRVMFGGHTGGGIQALLTGNVWFRGDMKFSFNPGTALYVGAGFEFRFGG